jgi:catalase (peroxidase I)
MTPLDMVLRWDAEFLSIAQNYAANNSLFLDEFSSTWTRVMNADRFEGPSGRPCSTDPSVPTTTAMPTTSTSSPASSSMDHASESDVGTIVAITVVSTVAVTVLLGAVIYTLMKRSSRPKGGKADLTFDNPLVKMQSGSECE